MIKSVIYAFSANNKPQKSVVSGAEVIFKTMDCFSNKIKCESDTTTHFDYNQTNPASGPVFIKDAHPGDTLMVEVLAIEVDSQGVITTLPGCGPLHETQQIRTKVIPIKNGIAQFNDITFSIDPMIGVIGVAPAVGHITCGYPGKHGGNLDCRLIRQGATLYFPVQVEGALLALGDLHAAMGDAELCGTGIEIAGEVRVKVSVLKSVHLDWPVLETKEQWYVLASASDYPEALKFCSQQMQTLMMQAYGWDHTDCYLYLSVQGNVEVCQGCKPCVVDMILRLGIPKLPAKPLIKK